MIAALRKLPRQLLVGFYLSVVWTSLPVLAAELETTQVFISNGQLEYVGDLNDGANQRLFDLYEKLPNKPTMLSIRSLGGEVNTGMALGAWVYSHQLNVRVLEFCLSSCANYVFTAAKQKIVSNFAVVGYHGGPGDLKKLKFDAKTDDMLSTLGPEARKTMMNDFARTIKIDGQREVAYFQKIGVRSDISSLGQDDQYEKFTAGAAGWTYSQEDFALLGVRNITVINPPWKPASILHEIVFATIPVPKITASPLP